MSKIDHNCIECDAKLTFRQHTERVRVGRYKVDDASCLVPVCTNGHAEISLKALVGYEQRAATVVLAEVADIGGAEIRFARKAIGLTQARLAALLDVDPATISRWENDDPNCVMSRVSRLALLAVVRDFPALERLEKKDPARIAEVLKVHAA